MSYSRTSFAFDAAVGNERDAVWNRLPDFGRKSKRKVIGDVVHQQFNPSFQQQQNDHFHTFHHQQMQGPGILLDPSLPPQHPPHQHLQHQQLPHLYNQHVNYHNHHPSISHPVIPPPVAYDAAFPPRPPVIDPITSLPVSVSVPMPVPVPVVNDPVSTQFRRPPPAPLHTNLFPSVDLSEQQSPLPPHHLRRPPFHVNPVIPPREVVGNYESESHPLADMVANDTEQQQFERPPFDEPTPNTTESDNQEEDCPPEQKDYSKRRRIFQVGNANGTDCQTLLNTNFPNPACAPSIQSPTHTSTNSSVVSMSPAVQPLAAPAASALPTPSPLSLSVQSTTRLFADSSTVSSIASSTSSIASSVSHSLVSSSPNLISTPIATLVRSTLLRPLNGRYAHLHAITNKGFGATYKAWDLQTSKPVFLKRTVLSSKMFSQREAAFMKLFTCFRRRYPGSLRFLVDYVDDFICQLDTNEAPCHWLALDYVSGGDLVQLLRECHSLARPLQEDDVRIIIHRLCEAIGELHALRVVHMDVSLENICIQWLNNENGVDDDMRVQLLLIDFEWSMMDMRGNALQQMVAQMEAEAQAANGTAHFQEMQTSAIEMRKAYDHVMLHPTPMHFYSDQYSDRRLRLQRRHEAVGKISYLSSEAKNLHSSFDPYKNEVFAIGACAYRLMFMCGPGEKNALTDSRTISNEFLSFLTETFQPEEKRIHTEEMLSHPWLTVMSNPNHSHHVRARSQSLAAAHQQMNMNHVTRVTDNGGADRWQHLEMDEKSRENSS